MKVLLFTHSFTAHIENAICIRGPLLLTLLNQLDAESDTPAIIQLVKLINMLGCQVYLCHESQSQGNIGKTDTDWDN